MPRDTPGLQVVRGMTVFGYDDRDHGGHAELVFDDVRVPAREPDRRARATGFAIAQARLGPGRIHHCMRCIGMAERAIELMCPRAGAAGRVRQAAGRAGRRPRLDRRVAGPRRAAAPAGAQDRLADGHRRQQGRAHRDPGDQDRHAGDRGVDPRQGDPGPRRRRPQPGLPAGRGWAEIRTLRFADGPDEVHKNALAKSELARQTTQRAGGVTVKTTQVRLATYPVAEPHDSDFEGPPRSRSSARGRCCCAPSTSRSTPTCAAG